MKNLFVGLLISIISFELCSQAVFVVFFGQPYSYGLVQSGSHSESDGELTSKIVSSANAVHPYTGYVYDPHYWLGTKVHSGLPISDWGYVDDKSPVQSADPGKVIIGVFGGSVALSAFQSSIDEFREALHRSPKYADKELVVVRLALGGYKQPQHLATMSYLLAIGAHFDIVILVDGYNEAVLPVTRNLTALMSPYFPVNWYASVMRQVTTEEAVVSGKLAYLRQIQEIVSTKVSNSFLSYSATLVLVSKVGQAILEAKIRGLAQAKGILEQERNNSELFLGFPREQREADDSIYQKLADNWYNSSHQMYSIAQGEGARYFHFLQPNQYVPGSKPISSDEQLVAYTDADERGELIARIYPMLRERGQLLRDGGVNFSDLTEIFSKVEAPLYIDNCCHINKFGNDMLVREIAQVMIAAE